MKSCLLFLLLTATLSAAAPQSCVFCQIVAGTRQAESVVYRDDRVVAFLSIGQRNPGHVLIVPATHAENFLAVPAETMHQMTDVAHILAEAIKHTDLKMDGFHLQMNTGKAAGQSVFHAHLHLIPRFEGDANGVAILPNARGQTGQAEAAPMPKRDGEVSFPQSELAPIAAKIRAALAAVGKPET
jgi:diadenosine tetraphosphate (Ap4A) HIT family hydrolase